MASTSSGTVGPNGSGKTITTTTTVNGNQPPKTVTTTSTGPVQMPQMMGPNMFGPQPCMAGPWMPTPAMGGGLPQQGAGAGVAASAQASVVASGGASGKRLLAVDDVMQFGPLPGVGSFAQAAAQAGSSGMGGMFPTSQVGANAGAMSGGMPGHGGGYSNA
eukprot:gene1755-2095_t